TYNNFDIHTNNINQLLYQGNVGTSVEASIDHRLFSEEGRKDVAKDFFITGNAIKSITDAIVKESQTYRRHRQKL
ncbi:MAG: hypothetical protein LBL65_06980, partial [Campylobacteraceae bacterium]|nr:hypothetical protein [Campylobacteraceae bacterium]